MRSGEKKKMRRRRIGRVMGAGCAIVVEDAVERRRGSGVMKRREREGERGALRVPRRGRAPRIKISAGTRRVAQGG